MSELSEKLSEYIEKSGYNIYQLSKEAELDRTTLQKTVKGQRLPSLEFIKKICSYIKINREQEEEIYHLFQIEKVGRNVVDMWDEISGLLEHLEEERNKLCFQRLMDIRFDSNAFTEFNRKEVQILSDRLDVMKAIICLVEEELVEQENPEIFMDDFEESHYVLSQLVQSEYVKKKRVVFHQLINLKSLDWSKEEQFHNIKILRKILPFAFVFQNEYDVRYSYVSGKQEDARYCLWPHYIITHRHVLLRAEGNDEILLISNEKIAYCYSMQMKKMLLSYRSLLEFEVFPGRVVSVYNDLVRQNFEHIVFESMPNMTLLLSEEQRKAPAMIKWFDDYEQLITEAQQQEETVYIFGLNGLQDFILTGNWPGVSDTYFYVETSEQRRQYVEVFYQQLLKKTRKFRLLKNEKLGYSFGMRFDLFGKNKLIVSSTDLQMPYRFIIISELGICEAFQKFFENLMESENLYSEEETVVRFEEMMEILQYKCG